MNETILRINEVCERLGISDTTLWRWRRAGHFPEPHSITGSSIKGWNSSTIDSWIYANFKAEQEPTK